MTTKSIEVRTRWLGHLKNYKIHGKDIGWYFNGQKHWEVEYKEGKHHGNDIGWYVNGEKAWKIEYKNGNII